MNAVGFWVVFLSHPINGFPVVSIAPAAFFHHQTPQQQPVIRPAPRLRSAGLLQKQTVDNDGVNLKKQVLLHPVLLFIGPQDLSRPMRHLPPPWAHSSRAQNSPPLAAAGNDLCPLVERNLAGHTAAL